MTTEYFNGVQAKFLREIGRAKYSTGFKREIKDFTSTGALWPRASVAKMHEPLLQIDRKDSVGLKNGKAYVCQHWEVNVSMVDEGWTTEMRKWHGIP